MSQRRLRVALIFGGRSGEHDVSLLSAASILEAIDRRKFSVIPVAIDRRGRWLRAREPGPGSPLAARGEPIVLLRRSDRVELALLEPGGGPAGGGEPIDIVFPVLHGPFGEDGTVQGLFEIVGVPYVGAGVTASACGMDKGIMKALFRDAGLPTPHCQVISRAEWERDGATVVERIADTLTPPWFVKPANLGSSVGISRVKDPSGLPDALELAAGYDRRIVVEEAVPDPREIEVSVLGNDDPSTSVAGEIVPSREFYDYEAKYLDDASELLVPAPLPPGVEERVREMAVGAFRAIDGAGLARVDFLIPRNAPEKIFVNEINTMPGFTRISMFPKLWEASGLAYPDLIDRLIELGFERHRERERNRIERAHRP